MNAFDKKLKEKQEKKKKRIYKLGERFQTEYLILVPLLPIAWLIDKITHYFESRNNWNERRVKNIITRKIVKHGDVDKEENSISYILRSWGHHWSYMAKFYNKKFANKYNHEITEYFLNEYEMKGYTKIVEPDEWDSDWTYITFIKK